LNPEKIFFIGLQKNVRSLRAGYPQAAFFKERTGYSPSLTITEKLLSHASVTAELPRRRPDVRSVAVTVIVTGVAVDAGWSMNDQ
jgi:hypothetical protein